MWKCENHMEVRGINDFGPAFIHPEFFLNSLAVRAAAVLAGTVMDLEMPSFPALAFIVAESAGFAVHNGMGGFLLDTENVERIREALPAKGKNLLDAGISHGEALPSGQKGLRHGKSRFQQGGHK